MEIKEAILSTLAELEGEHTHSSRVSDFVREKIELSQSDIIDEILHAETSDDLKFFQNLRERILVLFEGFQSPNNTNIEAKVDLTLNFLEYLLATIDERIDKLER